VNEDPHQGGWICKLADFDRTELDNLLSPEQYEALLKELG
jgi:glycine cleavage system H lipoate-binding protein